MNLLLECHWQILKSIIGSKWLWALLFFGIFILINYFYLASLPLPPFLLFFLPSAPLPILNNERTVLKHWRVTVGSIEWRLVDIAQEGWQVQAWLAPHQCPKVKVPCLPCANEHWQLRLPETRNWWLNCECLHVLRPLVFIWKAVISSTTLYSMDPTRNN